MATKRKNENETIQERDDRIGKEAIANYATRSEKTAWNRKQTNLTTLIETEVHPIENQILDLQASLRSKYDTVRELREEMVDSCVHPFDTLVVIDEETRCKFCDKTLTVHSSE